MTSNSPQLRQFTEQLGHLINISRIIDRNRDDGGFALSGGEIVYVFDTNVVQMFLEPYKNPQFCEVFHTPIWGGDRETDRDANSQACLIAAEYLLSGNLPGQRLDGLWYMTRGHKAELDIQASHLRGHVSDNVSRMRNEAGFHNQVFENVARLTEALDIDPAAGRAAFIAQAEAMGWRAPWLRELTKLTDKQFRDRAPGIRAREVCRILARDDVAEPANQLFRYRSGEIAGRFKTLEDLLDVDPDDREAIDIEINEWRAVLADVMTRRPANIKTRDGFKADCHALGLISWAGRQPKYRRRRFVLVTGDAVLLEAYRWRHVQDPKLRPYLVRPINHFAPLFNPVSARSTLAFQEYAFLKLQQVLEFVLVSINLQLLVDAEPETRLRARDAFVLEAQQQIELAIDQVSAAFPQSDDPIWLRGKTNELERLVQELRPIERLMLEAFPNLIAPRLKQDRMRFEDAIVEGGEALLAAIEKQLQAASEIGAQFSLQTTPDTIVRLFETARLRKPRLERRATVHVRLSFGEGGADASAEATMARLQDLTPSALHAELEALKGQPAKLFALAALLAFRLEIWKEAARYSELAATASLEQTKYVERRAQAPAEHFEYTYLMAASLRFRLAAFEPSSAYTYSDPWDEWLRIADQALADCLDYHRSKEQLTRVMRAQCERAALHVSYCEWFAFSLLNDPTYYPGPEERAMASFEVVVTELRNCEDMLGAAEAHSLLADKGASDGPSQTMLGAVRRQFRSNVHAAITTAERLRQIWPSLASAIDALLSVLPAPQFEEAWPDGPSIARAYSAAVQGDAEGLATVEQDQLSLALDRAVLAGLRRMVAARNL